MSNPSFQRVEELFHQAAALDPAERADFLEGACGGDAALRAAVVDLLKHHSAGKDTESFLVSPLTRAAELAAVEAPTWSARATVETGGGTVLPRVPGYEILQELGRGGMGVVYKARQIALNRIVALKMLLPLAPVTAEQLSRFRTEAAALARLHHPNIVPIYDFGECDGRPYFSMAYVPGPTLAKVMDGRAQDVTQAAQLTEVLARAVDAIHRCGIIHRDLKPGNIMLAPLTEEKDGSAFRVIQFYSVNGSAAGVPMIGDFGLATEQSAVGRLTVTGTMMGTPAYMAPEQVRGRAGAVGPGTDVYALGSILYELLTGRPPFDGETPAETLAQLLRDEPLSPARLRPRLPRDLVTICLKCLEKVPRKRFASTLELAEELRRFQAGEPIRCRPVGRVERAYRWCRRQPLASALLALSVLLTVAFIATVLVYNARLKEALEAVEAQAEQQRHQIVQLNVTIGLDELQRGDGFAAVLRFTEALRLDGPNSEREQGHRKRIAAALRHSPRLVELTTHDKQVVCAHAEGKGSLVATARDGNEVEVRDLTTGQQVGQALPHGAVPVGGAVSADNRLLATVAADGTVIVWDLGDGTSRRLPLKGRAPARRVAFVGEGSTLFIQHGEFGISLWGLTAPSAKVLLELPGSSARHAAFSDNGRWLFSLNADGTGEMWDAAVGQRRGGPLRLEYPVTRVVPSNEGRKLALVDAKGTLRIWDVAGGRQISGPVRLGQDVSQLVFSPGDERLLTAEGDSTVRIWRVQTGELLATLAQPDGAIGHAQFSPDGRLVATGDRESGARVWDAATGRAITPPLRHGAPFAAVGFAEGSKRLVTIGQRGTVCVWELPGKEEAEPWRPDAAPDMRPVQELVVLAKLLACGEIDEKQARVPLDARRLHAAWKSVEEHGR